MVTNKKVAGHKFIFSKLEKDSNGYRAKYIVSNDKSSFYLYFHGKDKKISKVTGVSMSKMEINAHIRGIMGEPRRNIGIVKLLLLIDMAHKGNAQFSNMKDIVNRIKIESSYNLEQDGTLGGIEIEKIRAADGSINTKYIQYDDYGEKVSEVSKDAYIKDKRRSIDEKRNAARIMKIVTIGTGLATIIGLILTIIFITLKSVRVVLASRAETLAGGKAEEELNEYLFKGQNEAHPAFEQYKDLISVVEEVVKNKNSKGCLLYGPPGTGKTYNIRRQFHFNNFKSGKDYVIIKGTTINIIDLYQYFYDNSDKIIVLDDFDKAIQDDDIVNLLKAATDSYPVRILSLPQHTEMSSSQSMGKTLPDKFKFTGKMIIVTNLGWGDINTALKSRLPNAEVSFNEKEFLQIIQKMLKYFNPDMKIKDKQEVFDYLLELTKNNKHIKLDLRTFSICIDIRLSIHSNWKDKIDKILLNKSN